MARETLTEVKKERDALKKELEFFKKTVVTTTMDFDEGCTSGKERFLDLLGLLDEKDITFDVSFEVTVPRVTNTSGLSKETIVDSWVDTLQDNMSSWFNVYSSENDYQDVEFEAEFGEIVTSIKD